MSVLVYTENAGGKFKKSTFEAVSYARAIADQNNTNLTAISIGDVSSDELASLGKYGTEKVLNVNATEIEKKIQKFLDEEIRPAVATDGGDVSLDRFEDGVVYLHMQGSCSGCPSSTMTLKMGIETKLKEVVPEVMEVVQV